MVGTIIQNVFNWNFQCCIAVSCCIIYYKYWTVFELTIYHLFKLYEIYKKKNNLFNIGITSIFKFPT